MNERSKKIIAGTYRRAKIIHIFATISFIAVGLLMLAVVYAYPLEPQAWLGLAVAATCIWYALSEWKDVMHPERHDVEYPQTPAGQAG